MSFAEAQALPTFQPQAEQAEAGADLAGAEAGEALAAGGAGEAGEALGGAEAGEDLAGQTPPRQPLNPHKLSSRALPPQLEAQLAAQKAAQKAAA